MLVGGLNNLGFVPQAAKTAKGQPSSTEGRDDLSFEEALGQAADNETPETAGDKTAPKVSAKESSQASPQVSPSNIPGGGPSIPSVERPLLSDRVSPMGVNPPLAKMAEPTAKMGDEAVNSLTKRVVWNDFLRKMKSELGVSAEDVLNAFASLSEEELSLPPEQSVDKVVMALGLDGQQATLAKQYFSELIRKTKPQSLGQELARSERDISLTLMSQRDIERRMNQKSVDRMQQQFFMNGAYPRTAAAAAGTAGATASAQAGSAAQNMPLSAASQAPVTPFSTPTSDATTQAFNPNPMTSASSEKSAIKLDENFKPVAEEKPAADVDSLIKKFMTGQAESARMQSAPPAVSVAPEATAAATAQAAPTTTPAPAAAQLALQQIFGGQREGSDASPGQDEGEYTADASYLASTAGLEGQLGKTQGPSEFQTQLSSVQGSQPMAVQDIVQQARVMVHDGGGEMKVTLRPDGLGEVAMRVSVNDGKVNVQMITESDEAKRLIERQLGDLKTSLTSQHLSVDSIKVDTATNLGKQLEQQYNDAQRQMAQQTLEQYRQDQQGWRRSFFEVPSARVYKDQTEAPRDVKAPSASSRRAGNRRLDLVA